MKRLIPSLVRSLRAPAAPRNRRATLAAVSEGLESRTMMAADLSGNMVNKFGNGTASGYTPGIITSAGTGQSGPSGAGDTDDKLTTAKRKSLNFTSDSEISGTMDVDLYRFTVSKAGQRVTFDVDRPALSTLDSHLRLFNAAGQEIAGNDDHNGTAPNEPLSSEAYLDFTFGTAGIYYVGVSGAFNDAYNPASGAGDVAGSTGKYKLRAEKYVNPDGNDTLATAGDSIGKTDDESGRISFPEDVDIYKIKVDDGDIIAFDIDANLGFPLESFDTFLRLFDDNGVELAFNDDGVDPNDPTEVPNTDGHSYFEYTFLERGTYFIAVSGTGNDMYDPITGAFEQPGAIGRYVLYTTLLNP